MKVVVAMLVLSNLFVGSTAFAKDAKEAIRDHLTFCSQFIIHDPDPRTVLNPFSQNIHDCHMYDWGTVER